MMRGQGGQQQGHDEGEMVEIDVLQGHHHPHQQQYQQPYQQNNASSPNQNQHYHQDQYHQDQYSQNQYQEYNQNPYGGSYASTLNESQPDFPFARALTSNAPSPQPQQQQFQTPPPQFAQPPAIAGGDEYGPPGWANRHSIGMSGAPSIGPSISGMDTPVDSRAATPTLKSGQQTPFDYLPAPRHPWSTDSAPNSPMV